MKTRAVPVAPDPGGRPPLCPHCGNELSTIQDHASRWNWLANLHLFSCPSCRKALGVTLTAK